MCKLTCDNTWKGTAHGHRREGGGGAAKRRYGGRRAAKRGERGGVTVVAAVERLCRRRVAHQRGLGAVVAQVGVDRSVVGVIWPVLQRRAFVLFAPDATHRQACGGHEGRKVSQAELKCS